jgi:hypothetical protein
MKTNILLSLLLTNLIIFFLAICDNHAQTIKNDPVSGNYTLIGNSQLHQINKKSSPSKFNRKKVEQQLKTLKKISKLHSTFQNMNKAKLKALQNKLLKQKSQVHSLSKIKFQGKPTPFYKAPYVAKPINSSQLLVSNVLINGKANDTVYVGDPFTLTFSFAPNSMSALTNIYIDADNNGIGSPDDLLLTTGLMLDNSEYDDDFTVGTYKYTFSTGNGYSNIKSSLIFEINDYQSVSQAVLTVIQKPTPSVILGTLTPPIKNVLVEIGNYPSYIEVLTDSSGKFSANIERKTSNQVGVQLIDPLGNANNYIPPPTQYITTYGDTTNINLTYSAALSFIDGYAKDQFGAPVKNVKIFAEGNSYNLYAKTDSLGYYKFGATGGSWYIYPSVSWTNNYLINNNYFNITVTQKGTVHQDLLFIKANSTISGKVSFNKIGVGGISIYASSDTLYKYVLSSSNGTYTLPVFKSSSGISLYDVFADVAEGYYFDTVSVIGIEPPAENINFEFKKITGGREGTVSDKRTGKPIANAQILFEGVTNYRSVTSNEDGYYWVNLMDGQYFVDVYADAYYSHSIDSIIVVGSMDKLNIELDRSGSFSGTVKDEKGNPLSQVMVYENDSSGYYYRDSYTDNQGHYVISGLNSGKYKSYASANGYITQWYNKVSVPDSASYFSVSDGYDTPGIDFVLSKGGTISGRIVDKLGNGIPDVQVEAYDSLYSYGGFSRTDYSGYYSISGLISTNYYVATYSPDYINQWYDGATEYDKAKKVKVVINQNTSDINFTLYKGASISGFIKNKDNNGIGYADIVLLDSLFNLCYYGNSDYTGQYSVKRLAPSKKYYVYASSYGYAQRWYNNVSTPDSATPIILKSDEEKDNINFYLPLAGSISGIVRDNLGVSMPNVEVHVQDSAGANINYGTSDDQGNYSVPSVSPGKYYAYVNDYIHDPQWFDHKSSMALADLINVKEDQTTPDINFDLVKQSIDSIIIKLTLNKIPDNFTFNQSFVNNNYIEYWWGVGFDIDGDINTGTNGCEIEIALLHIKKQGDSTFMSNIIDGTDHVLMQYVGFSRNILYSDVNIRIDPADKYTLIMTVPKSWTEISQITSATRFYAHSYYLSSKGNVADFTSVGKDMVQITDPAGDVAFDFADIVSAGWNIRHIESIPIDNTHPLDFKLEQNYPNPFNPSTTIRYALPYESSVKIVVYNLLGQVVKVVVNEVQKPGYHQVNFNAENLSSGVYFYSITGSSISNSQDFKDVKKMLLLK